MHTFSVIRIGDLFIVIAICIWIIFGISIIFINYSGILVSLLLLFCAFTKSAQFPFVSWLPLAIAAPTPIRALVHSSTLVTAGIFILIRVEIFNSGYPELAVKIIIILGIVTALIGALFSSIERDLKKAIAFSTLSHCGIIVFGLSTSSVDIVYFHLIIHAFLKSILFILAGWSLVRINSNQDLRLFGQFSTNESLTKLSWVLNGLNIRATPFIGVWYSKHRIINYSSFSLIVSVILIIISIISRVYIWRLVWTICLRSNGRRVSINLVRKWPIIVLNGNLVISFIVVLNSPIIVHSHITLLDLVLLVLYLLTPVIINYLLFVKDKYSVFYTFLVNPFIFSSPIIEVLVHEAPSNVSNTIVIKLSKIQELTRRFFIRLIRFCLFTISIFILIYI